MNISMKTGKWIYTKTSNELYHHGILGQKWGVRRYQNSDGTLTDEGKTRYRSSNGSNNMPTVKQNIKNEYINRGKELTKNADGYKKWQIQQLDKSLREFQPEFSKKYGTKSVKDTRNYLMDSIKGWNESDIDATLFQRMGDSISVYQKGYLDTKTLSKYYDAEAAANVIDYIGYGYSSDDVSHYYNMHQKAMKEYNSQENLLKDRIWRKTNVH